MKGMLGVNDLEDAKMKEEILFLQLILLFLILRVMKCLQKRITSSNEKENPIRDMYRVKAKPNQLIIDLSL